jgi:hypothetical protein
MSPPRLIDILNDKKAEKNIPLAFAIKFACFRNKNCYVGGINMALQ